MNTVTKKVCLMGIGVALFVVMSLCLQVPIFQNYYLCLGYVVMAVYCYSFGPVAGMTVGCMGVILYCLLISGLRGMPGWAIGNLVIGFNLGVACQAVKPAFNGKIRAVLYGMTVITSTLLGILVIKSLVEVFLYAQPFFIRAANNIYAVIADIVVLLLSYPACLSLEAVLSRTKVPQA